MDLPRPDAADAADVAVLPDLEAAQFLELLAERLDRERLGWGLEVGGGNPVVGEGVAVAEPAGHAPRCEGPYGLDDRQEERLLLLPLLLRIDDDLDLGEVQVPEELLR